MKSGEKYSKYSEEHGDDNKTGDRGGGGKYRCRGVRC